LLRSFFPCLPPAPSSPELLPPSSCPRSLPRSSR
jgi:hypothetical protein